jgi:hypothetical protein
MEDDDGEMSFWIYGEKGTCKNVSTPTLESVFERSNKECEIRGTYISYLGVGI